MRALEPASEPDSHAASLTARRQADGRHHRPDRHGPLRAALWAKLQAALDGEPDPWFALQEAKVDTRQFTPLVTA